MKYIVFFDDMIDNEILVWKCNKEYEITFENENIYHAKDESIDGVSGIEKKCEDKLYKIIEK